MLFGKSIRNGKVTGCFIGAVLCSPVVVPSVSAETGFQLEEVVVTARKREESLQDTPVAVSAFTANELKLRQINSTDQLSEVTPNLTFDAYAPSSGSNASSQIYIRGIGQSDFTAVTDPGVGLYVDGVYYSRSIGGSVDFLDLERIEVLRGPQGTLFGRNTIGGAIAMYTRKPAEEFGGSVEVEVGDDDMRNVSLDIDLPLTDTLLSKVSLASRKRDGYVERVYDGKEVGDDDVLAGRIALQWTPSDNFDLFFAVDGTKEREQGAPTVSLGVNDQQTFAHMVNITIPSCRSFGLPPGPLLPSTMGDPNCLNETAFKDEFETEATGETRSELDYWGVNITATWDVADWLNIKSITAYRDMDAYAARDADNTQYRLFHSQEDFRHDQFSQEFQFSGLALGGSLKWLLGLYYFEEDADVPNPVQLPLPFVGSFISGGKTDNENFAVFSQATWDVTERLHLTLGIRYTDETKRFEPYSFIPDGAYYVQGGPGGSATGATRFFDCPTGTEPACPIPGLPGRLFTPGDRLVGSAESEEEFDDVTPMFNIAYDLTDDAMLYFTYAEGFKSGGFDQRFNEVLLGGPTSFDPETATTYEVGLKSSWLDNRLRVNMAAFFTEYEDQHIIVREGFAPITFNAGESEIQGFELETVFVPTEAWIIQANVGYIDAEYTKLDASVLANTPITKSTALSRTPEWSASLGVAYTTTLSGWGSLTPRLDWSYRSEVYNDAINTPVLRQPSYRLINASVSFLSLDEAWEVIFAGRNLGSELYLVTGNSALSTGASYTEGVFARETEWRLSVKYHF